jgi:transcriptional regulator with XRE-family HTH domain
MELSNKAIGRNLQKFRMLRDMKAADLAERVGLKEDAYTKYERGETKITVDFVQKVATALNVDPISILATSPDNFVETFTITGAAPGAGFDNKNDIDIDVKGDYNSTDKEQQAAIMELLKNQNEVTKLLIDFLKKKGE